MADRIASIVPDVRLIYLIRDPLIRLVSDYMHRVSDGVETQSLDDFVFEMADTPWGDRGRYFHQIRRYLSCFDRDQLLVLTSDRLRGERGPTLSAVFRFLGVDPAFSSPEFDRTLHESRFFQKKNAAGTLLKRIAESRTASIVPANTRREIGKVLYRPFARPLERPELGPDAKAFAREFYREDAAALREFLADPLSDWSV